MFPARSMWLNFAGLRGKRLNRHLCVTPWKAVGVLPCWGEQSSWWGELFWAGKFPCGAEWCLLRRWDDTGAMKLFSSSCVIIPRALFHCVAKTSGVESRALPELVFICLFSLFFFRDSSPLVDLCWVLGNLGPNTSPFCSALIQIFCVSLRLSLGGLYASRNVTMSPVLPSWWAYRCSLWSVMTLYSSQASIVMSPPLFLICVISVISSLLVLTLA